MSIFGLMTISHFVRKDFAGQNYVIIRFYGLNATIDCQNVHYSIKREQKGYRIFARK